MGFSLLKANTARPLCTRIHEFDQILTSFLFLRLKIWFHPHRLQHNTHHRRLRIQYCTPTPNQITSRPRPRRARPRRSCLGCRRWCSRRPAVGWAGVGGGDGKRVGPPGGRPPRSGREPRRCLLVLGGNGGLSEHRTSENKGSNSVNNKHTVSPSPILASALTPPRAPARPEWPTR